MIKKLLFIVAVAAMFSVVSCNKEEAQEPTTSQGQDNSEDMTEGEGFGN